MSLLELLRLAIHNLLRMRARVVMTAIGVVIGTAAVVILMSLGEGLQRESLRGIEQMGSLTELQVFPNFALPGGGAAPAGPQAPARRALLTDNVLAEFRKLEGVSGVVPQLRFEGGNMELRVNRMLSGGANMIGMPADQIDKLGYAVATGTLRLTPGTMVIGWRVGEQFFDPVNPPRYDPSRPYVQPRYELYGKTMSLILNKQAEDGKPVERVVRMRVAAVLKEAGNERDSMIYVSQNDLVDINQWFGGRRPNFTRDGYPQAIVRAATVRDAERLIAQIKERGFQIFSPLEFIKQIQQTFAVIQAVLGGIGAIALIVAAFGIANTMVMAIYERTREIGLMKAVGASDRDVLLVFLIEAASIGLLGGIFGVLFGWLAGEAVSSILSGVLAQGAPPGGTPPDVVIMPGWLPPFAIAFATLIGLLSGLYPAVRATRLDPIVALRQQ